MKKKNQKKTVNEEANASKEEQILELNELMNVQGGIEGESSDCGLGCYMGGVDPGKNDYEGE